jgi:hypothetical protein
VTRVETCNDCGGLFAFLPRGICADCQDLRERRYQAVREWLLDNRGASVPQTSEATGVDESLISEFVREGRLEVVGSGPATTPAEEELKERIRRDLAERAAAPPAPGTDAPARAAHLGMRSRVR